ncbi:HemK2/MTQ2 family protein methyltransferase [Streptomyces sporangiiformans]|uniref:Methyltransferase n=1 Tax=Streptomyces sporangiiformans TaxID=2315329 RepID=A0A505D7A8_9ACTN|nr:HemK2/MTQ2 family protein methyltransferase [Streptomyces sporangiiformans]TPQ18737.1 methyltransferase [Streptomyces sporangiiformans]
MAGLVDTVPPPTTLLTPLGVYRPQADTFLLAQALCGEQLSTGAEVLDLGTGNGTLAICAARQGARVTAIDISWRAVLTTRLNALRSGQRLTVRHGDLLGSVPDRSVDLVVSNPPYVPTPASHRPGVPGAERAWNAGRDGRAVLDRICADAPRVLRPGGVLLMAQSGLSDIEETLVRLARCGLRPAVSDRAYIPFGPVLRSRLPWLRESGLVGEREENEELVIIRAERTSSES